MAMCGILLSILLSTGHADEFDWNSKHQELKETAVVEVGEVQRLVPPYGKLWTYEVLRIVNTCARLSSISTDYSGYGKNAGLLVVDKLLNYKVALIESDIGKKLKVVTVPVEIVDCESVLSSQPQSIEKTMSDIEKKQELSRRRLEAIQKELERLKQRQQQRQQQLGQ